MALENNPSQSDGIALDDDSMAKYEMFQTRLNLLLTKEEKIHETMAKYTLVKQSIAKIQKYDLKSLKTMEDIGSNLYVKCVVPKTDRVYLDIGLGYCVELSLAEATSFIDQKTAILKAELETLGEKAAEVKAHIKLFLHLISTSDLGSHKLVV